MRQPFLLTALLSLGVLPVLPRRKEDSGTPLSPPETEAQREARLLNERRAMAGKTSFADAYAREVATREAHAPVLAVTRVACDMAKVERDRPAQREARKSRKAVKKRRGW